MGFAIKFAVRKAERPQPPSSEELSAAQRLNRVASRSKVERSLYPPPPKQPEPPRIRRLFWSPDELD